MKTIAFVCSSLLALAFATQESRADQATGRWSGTFGWPLIPIHATLMPNGKVFSFGTDGAGNQAAYIYDVWTPSGPNGNGHQTLAHNQNTDIFCSATGLLPNGNVLVPGGDTRNPINLGIRDTLILNSGNNAMSRTGYMQFARWYPTLTTLPNGESIILGGRDGGGAPVNTPEVFNGSSWRSLWGATNAEINSDAEGKWFYPRSWVAPNGRLFGITGNLMYFMDWGGDGGVQLAGNIPNKTRSHVSTAVMYRPGEIFQAGGSVFGDTQAEGSRQAITVDIRGGWPNVQNLPDMAYRRVWANSTVLANGEVLVTGGSAFENRDIDTSRMAEMWNPDTRQFRQLRPAAQGRLYHSVSLLLQDGSVLVGGGGAPGPWLQRNAEIYYPPHLFRGGDFAPRPTIGDFSLRQNYNNVVNIPVGGDGTPARVAFIRTGAVTHSFDSSQRYMNLAFQNNGGSIRVTMPNSPNIAPPGYYMLFLLNGAGVPSISKIVSLNQGNPVDNGGGGGGGGGGLPAGLVLGANYELVLRHSGKCVDVAQGGNPANGTNILQWPCTGADNQRFTLQSGANGAFKLRSVKTNKCVDVSGGALPNGTNVQQWECVDVPQQAFRFVTSVNGTYRVKFEHSGRCMDVDGVSTANGANIHQWDCQPNNNQANQDFTFRRVGSNPPPPPTGPQLGKAYELVSRYSNKCVDVAEGGNPANGTNILQWVCTGGANQKFRLENAPNGAYHLVGTKNNKCVDVAEAGNFNGANIHQWDCLGLPNQSVRLIPGTGGSYQIKYEHSGKCMDVDGPSADNGRNIHQWDCGPGAANQEFFFRG